MSARLSLSAIRSLITPGFSLGATKTITAATNATPIEITTSAVHGLVSGDFALVQGVVGNTAANGLWKVTYVSTTKVTLDGSVGNAPYDSGGTAQKQTVNGLSRDLKPYHVRALQGALDRTLHVLGTDEGAGAQEAILDTIFPAAGNEP